MNQTVTIIKQIINEVHPDKRVILFFGNVLSLTLLVIITTTVTAQRIPCVDPIPSSPQQITSDFNAQVDIIPESEIIDCGMIPIGSPNVDGYEIWRDPGFLYKGQPSYYFKMESDKQRRVELQSLYVTQADIDEAGLTPKQVEEYQMSTSLYHFGKGEAKKGETWSYDYGLYLPRSLENATGIISQWHGMPDRTTVALPTGDTVYLEHDVFINDILSKMYFKQRDGYDRETDLLNGYYRDYGGNPPMALRVRNGYLYLICRLDRARLTNDVDERVHIYPPNNFPASKTSPQGNKTVYGIWSKLLSELPIETWIDMKIEVRWSNFEEDGSGVIDDGNVKLYMDDELMADWTGPIGNNDEHGTYFKYGLYVPAENGLEVRLAGFHQYQIGKTAPIITITTPEDSTRIAEGENLNVVAEAKDPDGSIKQVEFFDGSMSIGIDSASPYEVTLTDPIKGTHELTAVAEDDQGNKTTSTPIQVFVGKITGLKDQIYENDFRIYPNPANKSIRIEFNEHEMSGKLKIEIFNLLGSQQKLIVLPDHENNFGFDININDLKKGMYILSVSRGQNIISKNFFKN